MGFPDNYSQWEVHEAHMERLRARLPVCDECGETIFEDVYDDDGETVCEECLLRRHRKVRIYQ